MAEAAQGLSVIMPAYNEEAGVVAAVEAQLRALASLQQPFELVVVNDSSFDQTAELVDRLAAKHAPIRALHHEKNQGVGGAVRTGIEAAHYEWVMAIPMDNPLSVEELNAYLTRRADADIVIGMRERRAGYPLSAHLASFCYSRVLLWVLFGLPYRDPNWIHLYRRSLFTNRDIRIDYKGIFFPAHILIQAHRMGLKVNTISVRMRPRESGEATCFRFSAMRRTLDDMLDYWLRLHGWRGSTSRCE